MMKRLMLMAVVAFLTGTASAQREDPNNKYLVWTNNITLKAVADSAASDAGEKEEDDSEQGFIQRNFRHYSLCDWNPGMRFMVVPDKKDMVIRVFANASTNQMVSSMSLRFKVMEYLGHSNDGGLHDHINFHCVDDNTDYYYEIPSSSFDDYCNTKFGVPSLAYLGDVDIARQVLVGKKLLTKYDTYNVDISTTSYGYDKKKVKKGTEVTVVAAGVGTRQFPVKLIVEDADGNEFFQTVAISRTNSGLRDEEFEEDNVKHTFDGSFILLGEVDASSGKYQQYVGREVYTLYVTNMVETGSGTVEIPRLTSFKIMGMQAIPGSKKVRMTLLRNEKEYTKTVTFVHENVAGDIGGMREDYYFSLFASGNLGSSASVRKENLPDIQKSIVRVGFNEAEVKMALGEPDGRGKSSNGRYSWVYRAAIHGNNCTVFFSTKTKKVIGIQR